jgi:hypothetical protein
VEKAKAFYGKLFEWTLEDIPMGAGAYTMIKVGKGTGGEIMKHPMSGAPSAWLAYVEVGDIDATIIQDVTEVMGMGGLRRKLWRTSQRAPHSTPAQCPRNNRTAD